MRRSFLNTVSFIVLALLLSAVSSVQAQVRAYRVSDRQVQTVINRIETNTDTFRRQLDQALDRSTLNGTSSEDEINKYIADFEKATDSLRSRFDARRSVASDVEEVLNRANFINGFVLQNRLNADIQRRWIVVRNDLNLLANYYNVSWSTWSSTVPVYTGGNTTVGGAIPYRVSDNQVQTLLTRIEQRADNFKAAVDRSLDRSTMNNTASEDSINRYIADFELVTDRLRQRFNARTSAAADVEEVLNRAQVIEGFMRDYRVNNRATNQWSLLRTGLSTLATYYNVSWNWNGTSTPGTQYGMSLTGTYQLNRSQSDNVTTIIETALRTSGTANANQNDRVQRNLERRLSSPDMLVVENRNNQVTIASNLSPQVTFAADGVRRSETNPNGRTVNIRVSPIGSGGVEVAYEGDRTNDFFLTFMPMSNGQLRVTRRVYLENRNQTVTVNSVYDRISQTADFSRATNSTIGQNNQNYPTGTSISNDFVVPNGTQLTATLSSALSTQNMNDGDRFRMEVSSPSQYAGAIIEGYVSNVQRSGRVSGRAETTFNFDTIQLRNGNTYRFSGIIDQVRQPNGDTVSVNNEGAVRESSQTSRTVKRAGIGAAIGAIIGAIAGGGSGAAIGAGVGAGAGAGTVILQGRDNLELRQGAEIRITSSAPSNLRAGY